MRNASSQEATLDEILRQGVTFDAPTSQDPSDKSKRKDGADALFSWMEEQEQWPEQDWPEEDYDQSQAMLDEILRGGVTFDGPTEPSGNAAGDRSSVATSSAPKAVDPKAAERVKALQASAEAARLSAQAASLHEAARAARPAVPAARSAPSREKHRSVSRERRKSRDSDLFSFESGAKSSASRAAPPAAVKKAFEFDDDDEIDVRKKKETSKRGSRAAPPAAVKKVFGFDEDDKKKTELPPSKPLPDFVKMRDEDRSRSPIKVAPFAPRRADSKPQPFVQPDSYEYKEIILPERCVPVLIGRGGSTISDIRNRTGVNIQFRRAKHGQEFSKAVVTGSVPGVAEAERLIGMHLGLQVVPATRDEMVS